METTNSTSNANETLQESTKVINQWLNEVTNSMTDLYKKQLNLVSGFYGNLFNSFNSESNKNVWNPMKGYSDLFLNGPLKPGSIPFTNFGVGNNPFEKTFQQITEYNQNLFNSFSRKLDNGNIDWASINEKYQQAIEKEFEATQKLVKTMIESYNKRVENTVEINKDLQKEFSNQLNELFDLNKQIWADTAKAVKTKEETADKFSKNGNTQENEVKKNQKVTVHN
ncbi:MAG: hypothetical protein K0R26_1001 [Bacteroidota bacterium]|jgi:ribosomal protein S17E|nr:hypothetical protein [Bacteroidota bacterium]